MRLMKWRRALTALVVAASTAACLAFVAGCGQVYDVIPNTTLAVRVELFISQYQCADGKKQLMAAYKEGRIRVAKGSAANELNGQIQTRDNLIYIPESLLPPLRGPR